MQPASAVFAAQAPAGLSVRDLLLAVIVGALLIRTLTRAEFGVYLWTWLSLMNPHKMTYGFAFSLPWAQAAAGVTLLSFSYSKSRKPLPINGGMMVFLLLWLWMTVTSVFSINNMDRVWERWFFAFKIFLMLLVTLMLLRERKQINTLVAIIVFSIAFFGVKGGLYTLATGGAGRVWGPPGGMLEENNALAVALIMVLPFTYYLRHVATNVWLRRGLVVCMVLMGVSILGSQSRGALLALLAMVSMLGLKSKYPVRVGLVLVVILAMGIAFMPDSWTNRMSTIQTYEADTSAMSRLYTWNTLWNVAIDRPLTGAGFRADNVPLFIKYAPTDPRYAVFVGQYWVAHSIYLQALGEHGFVGLLLFLSLWGWVWRASGRLAKQAERYDDLKEWAPLLLRMCQVSTVGYLAGGAFLSLMLLDLPYYIFGIVCLVQCAIKDRQRGAAAAPMAPPGRPVNPGAMAQTSSGLPGLPGLRG